MVGSRPNGVLLLLLGLCAWGMLGLILIQASGDETHLEYYTTFPADPFTAGDWNKECAATPCCDWANDPPTQVNSSNSASDFEPCIIHSIEGDTVDTAAQSILMTGEGPSLTGTKQRLGGFLHATPNEADDWSTKSYIRVHWTPSGKLYVWEMTGNTADSLVCQSCCDIGSWDQEDHMGISMRDSGQDRQIRVHDFGSSPPSQPYHPSTWDAESNCKCGVYDSAGGQSAPGCDADYDGTFSSDAKYETYGGFGLYLYDNTSPYNRARIDEIWVSGEEW